MIYSRSHSSEKGLVDIWLISTISLAVLFLAVSGFSIWAFVNYLDQKDNVDSKVSTAVADAKKEQADSDEAKFLEREKEPMRQFRGPDDYGQVTFDYPKTWSVFVNKDASSGETFESYLNPSSVPPISSSQQFALRVTIEDKDYDKAVSTYDSLVKKGDLKSSSVTADGVSGVRLDGAFSKDVHGAAVMFKIRDKTLTVRTDANTFLADFNTLVNTIKFNQ